MSRRIKVSIVICVVFLILSSAITAVSHYINNGSLPGVSSKSFAPVTVNKVPDDEDIVVQVYQTGIPRHNDQSNQSEYSNPEIALNQIDSGWLTYQYQGYCLLVFDDKDSTLEPLAPENTGEKVYYIAMQVPVSRLKITDLSARHGEETTDPFEYSNQILIMSYSVASELYKLAGIQSRVLCCGAVNIAFIILVVGINLIISQVRRKRG